MKIARMQVTASVVTALLLAGPVHADQAQELLTLRNTMVGMLEKLVADHLITEEQARAIVDKAETEARDEVARRSKEEKTGPGTVRVAYVPQIVKDQLRDEIRDELKQEVTQEVIDNARSDGWGIPGAMPAWIYDIKWNADVRARGAYAQFDENNAKGVYRNFQAINEAGSLTKAGQSALLNVSENRESTTSRLRAGMSARIADQWSIGFRLSTGNEGNPVTRNVQLGAYNEPWNTYVDLAYARYESSHLLFNAGRFANPFMTTSLLFDEDLTFEGLALTGLLPVKSWGEGDRVFLTAGVFPLEQIALSNPNKEIDNKYLFAGQLGGQFAIGTATLSTSVGYFDFYNTQGKRNTPESRLEDFTAPRFVQKGNTLFNIRNDLNPDTVLYALAADYRVLDANFLLDSGPLAQLGNKGIHVTFGGDYLSNIGFNESEVFDRTGANVNGRTTGYMLELAVGMPHIDERGDWRVAADFRHLERDAVVDAFTDSDFHLGGTDAEGWSLEVQYGLAKKTWMRLQYMTANEIDGPPLGIDYLLLDLNTKF